jgi:hypothetical protein
MREVLCNLAGTVLGTEVSLIELKVNDSKGRLVVLGAVTTDEKPKFALYFNHVITCVK